MSWEPYETLFLFFTSKKRKTHLSHDESCNIRSLIKFAQEIDKWSYNGAEVGATVGRDHSEGGSREVP